MSRVPSLPARGAGQLGADDLGAHVGTLAVNAPFMGDVVNLSR